MRIQPVWVLNLLLLLYGNFFGVSIASLDGTQAGTQAGTHSNITSWNTSYGTWLRNPPFWKPRDANPRLFDKCHCKNCFQGRHLYVLGVSTARELMFHMVELLGGPKVNRQEQKSLCPYSQPWCTLSEQGVNMTFAYFDYMDGFDYTGRGGFPFLFTKTKKKYDKGNNAEEIACNDAEQCLKKGGEKIPWPEGMQRPNPAIFLKNFFKESTKNDVLYMNLGLIYATRSKIVDFQSWLIDSAEKFKILLPKVFPGHVVWSTVPQLHQEWSYQNIAIKEINHDLLRIWKENENESRNSGISTTTQWHVIDQWAINYGRGYLYADRIHYPGNLTFAALQLLLNYICPQMGVISHYPANMPLDSALHSRLVTVSVNDDEVGAHISSVSNESVMYIAIGGMLHKVENDAICQQYFVQYQVNAGARSMSDDRGVRDDAEYETEGSNKKFDVKGNDTDSSDALPISKAVLDMLPVASASFKDYCQEGSLLQVYGNLRVFIVENHLLKPLNSVQDMYKRNRDFSEVMLITHAEMYLMHNILVGSKPYPNIEVEGDREK